MPTWVIDIIILLVVVGFIAKRMLPAKGVRNISTAELKHELKDKKKQFIDGTPGEYKGNHIREFRNIPLQQLSHKAQTLSKEREVVVICQSGMRSTRASKRLKRLGFDHVTNVKGGMNAW
ncbi:MAG TPA: rhodanese-like domain-containing protein [Bacillales bacterium]|nr:rhodanese-like domain-containing protein [Bacillales bacterium]